MFQNGGVGSAGGRGGGLVLISAARVTGSGRIAAIGGRGGSGGFVCKVACRPVDNIVCLPTCLLRVCARRGGASGSHKSGGGGGGSGANGAAGGTVLVQTRDVTYTLNADITGGQGGGK